MSDYKGLSSKAVSGLFMEAYDAASWDVFAPQIAYRRGDSVQEEEIYRNPVSSGGMTEFLGELKLNNGKILEYRLRNKEYAVAFGLDKRQMQFDQTGSLQVYISDQAQRAALHTNVMLSDNINDGDAATSTGQDGFAFFSTAHEQEASGVQSNKLTSTAAVPATPTAVEMANAVMSAIAKMHSYKDEAGYPRNMGAKAFMLMYPSSMALVAPTAVGVDLLATGGTLQRNVVEALQSGKIPNVDRLSIVPIHNPLLTSAVKLFLFRTDGAIVRPFVWQERVAPQFTEQIEGSHSDVMRNEHVFKVSKNCATGYMAWRHAVQVTLTAP